MYLAILIIHILSTVAFVIVHGVSAFVALSLRRDTSRERMVALLNLSGRTIMAMYLSLLLILLSGIVLGFVGMWWGRGWIWLSLVLLIVEIIAMASIAAPPMARLRKAAGLVYFERGKPQPAVPASSAEEIAEKIGEIKVFQIAVIGLGGLAIIIWLMMAKPF